MPIKERKNRKKFNTKKSIKRANLVSTRFGVSDLPIAGEEVTFSPVMPNLVGRLKHTIPLVGSVNKYVWSNRTEKIELIRKGLPYSAIESIRIRRKSSLKDVLAIFNLPQTTYNKNKREKKILDSKNSELIIYIIEILDFGAHVFNNENEKFERWLKKPNISLGGVSPESLFDSITGIQQVKNCLNRIEFGNMA